MSKPDFVPKPKPKSDPKKNQFIPRPKPKNNQKKSEFIPKPKTKSKIGNEGFVPQQKPKNAIEKPRIKPAKRQELYIDPKKKVKQGKDFEKVIRNKTKRDHHPNLKSDYFEKIDNKDKAYWLGFLYADGYLSRIPIERLNLQISKKDEEIIKKFALKIGYNLEHQIYDSRRNLIL